MIGIVVVSILIAVLLVVALVVTMRGHPEIGFFLFGGAMMFGLFLTFVVLVKDPTELSPREMAIVETCAETIGCDAGDLYIKIKGSKGERSE